MIGDGAVIDRQFGTTDVAIVLPVAAISPPLRRAITAPTPAATPSRARSPEDAPLAAA